MGKRLKNIGERYLVEDLIEESELWETFRGLDRHLDRKVAIKVLRDRIGQNPSLIAHFSQSVKNVASLTHPNITLLYDYGQIDGIFFLVMQQLVDGTSLRRYLQSRGKLGPDRVVIIAHDVALGLAHAHRRNIVHGAVKT